MNDLDVFIIRANSAYGKTRERLFESLLHFYRGNRHHNHAPSECVGRVTLLNDLVGFEEIDGIVGR
jgi:hypothetical protein